MKKVSVNIRKLVKSEKFLKRFCAGGTALIFLASSVVWAGTAGSSMAEDTASETQEAIEKTYPQLLASASADGSSSKEETVYVIADADGKITSTTASEWLRNGTGASEISDVSTLSDIENTANDSGYTESGNGIVWQADGSDIKYKGTVTDELPVTSTISYYLDGEQMSASEIAGKAGNVEIRFHYNVKDRTTSGGYGFTTPYTMASGVLLDDKHFTNIEVTNGKAIDDGSSCICLGIAFPGMQGNLNIDSDTLDIPESVTIKAYTDCFEIDGSYTIALSGLLSDVDLGDTDSVTDKIDQLTSAMDKLESASAKLVSGAAKVSSGADTINTKAGEISDGAAKVSSGAGELTTGLDKLSTGASNLKSGTSSLASGSAAASSGAATLASGTEQLSAGASSLADGTQQVSDGAAAVAGGTGQVSTGAANLAAGTDSLASGVNDLANGAATLAQGVSDLSAGMSSLDAGLGKLSSTGESGGALSQATSNYSNAVKQYDNILNSLIESETDETKKAKLQGLKESLDSASGGYTQAVGNYIGGVDTAYEGEKNVKTGLTNLSSQLPTLVEGVKTLKSGADNVNAGAQFLAKGAAAANTGAQSLASGAAAANTGAQSLKEGAASANTGAQSLSSGAAQIASGAKTLDSGAATLKSGAESAASGSKTLSSGASSLADGTKKFAAGTSTLADGAETLYEGIKTFDKDGIKKLTSTLDDADIDTLLDKIEALADASKQTKLVGGIADGMEGSSKIIFKTGAVKAQ